MIAFLSPLFLAGALGAAIPIVLHLLRREPEARVKFAAVKMLRQAPVERTDRRRLRELLLLALRVAALLLLAVAFARPFLAAGPAAGGATIVALDTSFSLSGAARFERAQRIAKEAIARLPPGERIGVVTFADRAELAAGMSTDRALALSAIDRAMPGYGATRYRAALSLAAQVIGAAAPASSAILVVTDLQESGWDAGEDASIAEQTTLEVLDVGEAPPNLAIVSVRPTAARVAAVIRNSGAAAQEARVSLTVDGRSAGQASVTIGPWQAAEVAFPASAGATAAVMVDDRNGIQADNVRFLVLDRTARPIVLVVSSAGEPAREAFYLQQAITAAGRDGARYDVDGVAAKAISEWDQARLNRHSAVVLASTRGLERRGRELLLEYLRQGGGLLLPISGETDAQVANDTIGGVASWTLPDPGRSRDASSARRLAPADPRHPLFRAFGARAGALGLATFEQVATVRGGETCQPVARFTTGEAAVVDCSVGQGRVVVVASDLNRAWNDFPLHASFVPFVQEAIGYLNAGRSRVTEYLVADVPAGVRPQPGVATVTSDNGQARLVAVNVDPREADPSRLSPEAFEAAVTRMKGAAAAEAQVEAREQEARQHIWQYVLVLMLGTMVVESLVAARTA
jgi:hypothetical protein